jgi:hypothetical protein
MEVIGKDLNDLQAAMSQASGTQRHLEVLTSVHITAFKL